MTSKSDPAYLAENHNALSIVSAVVFPFISLLAVVARFVSKRMGRNGFQVDDWLLVGAWVSTATQLDEELTFP